MKKFLVLLISVILLTGCTCEECNKSRYSGEIAKIAAENGYACYVLKYEGHEYILGSTMKCIVHSESCPCHNSVGNSLGW